MEAKFKDLNKIILYKMDKDEETTSNLFADKLESKNTKVTKFYDNHGNCNNIMLELIDRKPPMKITNNGEYDVTDYNKVDVKVPTESQGTIYITENGDYNVSQYENANVQVEGEDISDYIDTSLPIGERSAALLVKKLPPLTFEPATFYANELFSGMQGLETLDVSGFDTSNVQEMINAFTNCRSLTHLDLSSWNLSNLTNADGMFNNCVALESLDLPQFPSLIYAAAMFSGCFDLIGLDTHKFDNAPLKWVNDMFVSVPMESFDLKNWRFDDIEMMSGMFRWSNKVKVVEFPEVNGFTYLPNATSTGGIFQGCTDIEVVLEHAYMPLTGDVSWFYAGCEQLRQINLTGPNGRGWEVPDTCIVFGMFAGCKNLISIDMSEWSNSFSSGIDNMFSGCTSLETLDIRYLIITNITSMTGTFDDIPDNCHIIVKDQTAKDSILSVYPNLTNITIADESI